VSTQEREATDVERIEWDGSLETGDEVVDLQHRTIHNLFNDLSAAPDNAAEILGALDFLTQHVLVHFATEEDLMHREGFPQPLADIHIAEHRTLTDEVRWQVLEFREGNLLSTEPLIAFLREWLVSHVYKCDRVLIEHVQARGAFAEMPEDWARLQVSSVA
jgi:hemerythrin